MVKTSDVNQGQKAPVSAEPAPFISEGVRADIEQYGEVIDPNTGKTLTRNDLKSLRK